MKRLFEFKCEDDHITEQFVNSEDRTSDCRTCGKPAKRIISAPRVSLDPISGDFPGATMKWARNREAQIQREKKAIANHGPDAAWDVARG